jgi:DHA2 family multidrug resistance protein
MTGWLANHFGRKRLLIASLVGFTAASFLCGLAPTLSALILFRIIQGISGGALQPISQAVLLEAFPPAERGKAMGFWGLGIVVAPILGPVLGGWLTDNYSWRWVFYINVPVGVVAVLAAQWFIFDPPYIRRSSERIDYWGIGLLTVGIGALQIALDQGRELDWFASHMIVALFIVAVTGLTWFVYQELKTAHPIVDLRVFKNRTYAVGVALMTLVGFVLFGSLILLPIMLQTLLRYPSVQAGIAMAPRGVGSFVAMPIVGILTSRFDPRKLLAVGFLSGGWTMFWLSGLSLDAGYWDIFWPQFVQGIALGLMFVPLTTVTMAPIPREEIGNATSLFNVMRNIGGSVGIAVTATVLARRQEVHRVMLIEHVTQYDTDVMSRLAQMRQFFVSQGADVVTATGRAYAAIYGMLQRQAAMLAFLDLFWILGVMFLLMVPLLVMMRRPAHQTEGVMVAE